MIGQKQLVSTVVRPLAITSYLVMLVFCCTSTAVGQFGGDPFGPYGNSYQSSSIPNYSRVGPGGSYRFAIPPGLGNLPGRGGFGSASAATSALDPYAQGALSQYQRRGGTVLTDPLVQGLTDSAALDDGTAYRANRYSDEIYEEWQSILDELYDEALNATGEERSEAVQRYEAARLRASRGIAPGVAERFIGANREQLADYLVSGVAPTRTQTNRNSNQNAGLLPSAVTNLNDLVLLSQAINRAALVEATRPSNVDGELQEN